MQVSLTMLWYAGQVDSVGAVGLPEIVRSMEISTRFYQTSTSEQFGSTPPPQNETSVFKPRSPYVTAKLMVYWCTVNYRRVTGCMWLMAFCLTMNLHVVVKHLLLAKYNELLQRSQQDRRRSYSWKSRCGAWLGYAKEYVKSVWLLRQQEKPSSYFVAMGVDATAKDFAEASFVCI